LERFVRGDQSRTTDGNGLGLAIAQSYVSACGGNLSITVDGDLFKVTIIFNKV
jgi:signal transduction histidine kinase